MYTMMTTTGVPYKHHFMLVGPKSNLANLEPSSDDVLTVFHEIVTCGNADGLLLVNITFVIVVSA
jgi:hypothetical protein